MTLRPALQDRTFVQAGCSHAWRPCFPLLDDGHGQDRPPLGRPISTPNSRCLPRRHPTKARGLSPSHPSRPRHTGVLQCIAATSPSLVWSNFGAWLCTIRPGILPSELVLMTAMRDSLPEFLTSAGQPQSCENSSATASTCLRASHERWENRT